MNKTNQTLITIALLIFIFKSIITIETKQESLYEILEDTNKVESTYVSILGINLFDY